MSNGSGNSFIPRSIQSVNALISASTNQAERSILLAKKAALLAKYSHIDEARFIVSRLRDQNAGYDPKLSAWIMFSEGLIEHFETPNTDKSRDKFVRSHLIGQVANDRELAGASAAWLANCYFVDGRLKDSADLLTKAFEWSDYSDGGAQGRACLVLADGFSMAGDYQAAKRWYQAARMHAVSEGDIAMQNVVLFNSTAFHIAELTLTDCLSVVREQDIKLAKLEIASASNLNTALGIASLPSMIPMMRADLLVIERQWSDAIDTLTQCIPNLNSEGQERQLPKSLAQRAWCHSNNGYTDGAASDIELFRNTSSEKLDYDDLSIIHFRLAGASKAIGDAESEKYHQLLGAEYYEKLRALQIEIKSLFDSVASIAAQKNKKPGQGRVEDS